jgi:5-formyltetrahydrofolate cyclo-ligase
MSVENPPPAPAEAPELTTEASSAKDTAVVSGSADQNIEESKVSVSVSGDTEGDKAEADAAEGDTAEGDKKTPSKQSPGGGKRSPGKRNTSAQRAATAAALSDPESLLEVSAVDETTKQTQCSIPYQRSTFLQVNCSQAEGEKEPLPPSKSSLRREVWNFMESSNVAAFPRPVYRRIPNFKEAVLACNAVAELPQFKAAQVVLIGPDRPQQNIRFTALEQGKTLLIPTSRLESSIFVKIVPPEDATKDQLNLCAATEGFKKHGVPVPLDEKIKVDLVIVGSVVVSSGGRRLGKGEGFADLEWAMMRSIEAVDADTTVVSCVHDSQVKEDLPTELFSEIDLTVDIITTPKQTLPVREPLPKPAGLVWSKITPEKLEKVTVLKTLREREEAAGKDVTLGESVSREIISRIDNEVDKCIQTMGGNRRRARSATQRSNRVQSKHVAKVKGIRKERNQRRRTKSLGEDGEEVVKSESNADIVKKLKQKRNKVRQRSLKNRKDSTKSTDENADPENAEKDEKDDDKLAVKKRNKKVEGGRGDAAEQRQKSAALGVDGKRRGGGRMNFPPQRYPPPWLQPYGAPPPGRYGGYYPPPPAGRYMYRNAPASPMDEFGYPGAEESAYYGPRRGGAMQPPPPPPGGAFYPTRRPAVYVGDIPKDCGEDMFNDMLVDRKVRPYRLIWQQEENRTFLVFDNLHLAKDCLRKLRNLSINDEPCRVDLSNMTKRTYFQ